MRNEERTMKTAERQPLKEAHFGVDFVFCQISGTLIGFFMGIAIFARGFRESDADRLVGSPWEAFAPLACGGAAITMALGGMLGSAWGARRAWKQKG
jgi:hypothetical protein